MYRANVERTGIYHTRGLSNLRGIKWKLQIVSNPESIPSSTGLKCPLVISNKTIYLCDKKGYFYAINSQIGEELWRIKIDDTILDNLIFHNQIVYASGTNGYIYAINVETQSIKWKSNINFVKQSNPVIYGALLLANSADGNLYALNLENGQDQWKFKTTKDMPVTPPSISNGVVYFGSENGNIYAVNINTGKEKWRFEVGKLKWLFSVPTVVDNTVYVGVDNSTIYALNADLGTEIWHFQVEERYYFSPLSPLVVDKEFVYVGAGIGCLCAIDLKSQSKFWQRSGRAIQRINSISLAEGIIYCERDGAINAIEAKSGIYLWEFAAPEPEWWIFNPKLWLPQIMNTLSKRFAGSSTIQLSSPVVADENIYTFCDNGYLYAIY
ncbi:MAG: PQQ-binding-like beta-propeller repeat protein [Cyanobacteria bacterium P01_A01_bin.83]